MRIVVGGASGFLGGTLTRRLASEGHDVTRLVRREAREAEESRWDPAAGHVDHTLIERADAVVNLSGAPIARWPWTASYRQELLDSRLGATHTLATAIAETGSNAALISGSGQSFYGTDRGDETLSEQATAGTTGVLAHVSQEWEQATGAATRAGARVCLLRTSIVLHRDGGAFAPMMRAFKLGGGAKLGPGDQYFSAISREDWVSGVVRLVTDADTEGPYNLASPDPVTNAQFTRELASALHRPAFLRVPKVVIRTALGGGLGENLIGSLRVVPERLQAAGFTFAHPTMADIIADALGH